MIFARPPEGFKVKLALEAIEQVAELEKNFIGFKDHWEGLKLRLKMTGASEGETIPGFDTKDVWIQEIAGQDTRYPPIALIYTILGESLTVVAIKVTS